MTPFLCVKAPNAKKGPDTKERTLAFGDDDE